MTFQLFIWILAITILFIISNSIAHAAGAREKQDAYNTGYIEGYLEGESKGASVDD